MERNTWSELRYDDLTDDDRRYLAAKERLRGDYAQSYSTAVKRLNRIEGSYATLRLMAENGAGEEASVIPILQYAYQFSDFTPAQEYAYTDYIAKLRSIGAYSERAQATRDMEAELTIKRIDYAIEQLRGRGIDTSDNAYLGLSNYRRQLQSDLAASRYDRMTAGFDREDVERTVEKLFAASEYAYSGGIFSWNALAGLPGMAGDSEHLEAAANIALALTLPESMIGADEYYSNAAEMTKEERENGLYILATKGYDEAKAYMDHYCDARYGVIPHRRMENIGDASETMRLGGGFLGNTFGSAYTVLTSPIKLAATVENIGALITGKDINPYSGANYFGSLNQRIRADVSSDIGNAVGDDAPVLKYVAQTAYDAGMSGLDSMYNAFLMGNLVNFGVNEAASVAEKFGIRFAQSMISSAPMGLQAAGEAMSDVAMRGGTSGQAAIIGLSTFAAETLTEAVSYENITEAFRGGSDGVKSFLREVLQNGLEEAPGEMASEIIETLSDDIVMGALSNRSAAENAYIDEGYSPDKAREMAAKDCLSSILTAGFAGFLSGGMSTTASIAAGNVVRWIDSPRLSVEQQALDTAKLLAQMRADNGLTQDQQTMNGNTQTEGTDAVEGAEQTDATERETTEAEAGTAEAEAEDRQEAGDDESQFINAAGLLNAAVQTSDDASVASTIAAVLSSNGNADQNANAAAMLLVNRYGAEEAAYVAWDVISGMHDSGKSLDEARFALEVAAFSGEGASGSALNAIASNGYATQEMLQTLSQTTVDELLDESFLSGISKCVQEIEIAQALQRLVQGGALNDLLQLQEHVAAAVREVARANDELGNAQNRSAAAGDDLLNAVIAATDSPSPRNLGMVHQAQKALEGAMAELHQYEQALNNAEQRKVNAERELARKREARMSELRAQAAAEVEAKRAAQAEMEAAQQAEAEAAKAQQQAAEQQAAEVENETSVAASQFVDEYFPDVAGEARQRLIERYMERGSTKPSVGGVAFAGMLGRNLGVSIRAVDSHGLFNAVLMPDGSISVDAGVTQDGAVRGILTHELVHKAEGTGYYGELRSTVIDLMYGGDEAAFNAEADAKNRLYSERLGEEYTLGAQEAVADGIAKLLDDSGLVQRLAGEKPSLAQRILETIRDVLRKIGMVKSSDMDRLRDVEKALAAAVRETGATQAGVDVNVHPVAQSAVIGANDEGASGRYSLPTDQTLDAMIDNHLERIDAPIEGGLLDRQFAVKTGQNTEITPDFVKRFLLLDENRQYAPDSNDAQMLRAVQRINQRGADACADALIESEGMLDKDANAEAQVLMAYYRTNDHSDPARFVALAQRYNEGGTDLGQALQARKMISKMTDAGMQQWLASHYMRRMDAEAAKKQTAVRMAKEAAARYTDATSSLDTTDIMGQMMVGGGVSATGDQIDPKYGVPVNEAQKRLIHDMGLDNVRPEWLNYNRATDKQRMLASILECPDPSAINACNGMSLVEAFEMMKQGMPVYLPGDESYIMSAMRAYAAQSEPDSYTAQVWLARAFEASLNCEPATIAEKYRTMRYTNMLFNVASAERNVIGNSLQNVLNAVAHDIIGAKIVDPVVSKMTGKRTTASISARDRAEGFAAFREEIMNTWNNYRPGGDQVITSAQGVKYETTHRGRVFQNSMLEGMRLAESFLMSVGDRPFWAMAYANSMAEQRALADMNGEVFNADAAAQRAAHDADYATFTEDNALVDLMSRAKRIPRLGFIIDLVAPFTGVPTNVAKRMFEYSPGGLAVAAIREGARQINNAIAKAPNSMKLSYKDFNQSEFVNAISRGITGTMLYAVGFALGAVGAIKLGTGAERDKKKYALEYALGDQYGATVEVFGQNIALSTLNPASAPLIMGASVANALGDDSSLFDATWAAVLESFTDMLGSSYLSSLKKVMEGDDEEEWLTNVAIVTTESLLSQTVPSFISQTAQSVDRYVRDTKDADKIRKIINTSVINKIPFLRQAMLPAKVDIAGREVPNSKSGIGAFINPFTMTSADDDPVMREMLRIAESTGNSDFIYVVPTKFTLNKVSYSLADSEDKAEFQKHYGAIWTRYCTQEGMAGLTDDQKEEYFRAGMSRAMKETKAWWASMHR